MACARRSTEIVDPRSWVPSPQGFPNESHVRAQTKCHLPHWTPHLPEHTSKTLRAAVQRDKPVLSRRVDQCVYKLHAGHPNRASGVQSCVAPVCTGLSTRVDIAGQGFRPPCKSRIQAEAGRLNRDGNRKRDVKSLTALGGENRFYPPFDGDEVLLAIVVAEAAITALSLMLREQ
jgi:hypothetical protein